MSGNGDQLVSFFLYSMFIYPVTNYIVSPQRKYPRWRAAAYAIIFLIAVSTMHMMYENMENGPNHYQLLKVTRDTPVSIIKKSYRSLSLEFHPDKNKDPAAADTFTKIKHAFDVITDKDKRREYNRLGEHGVAVLAQSVIDYKYILLQLIVYYSSSAIFAFLMTFSEPTGDAFQICLFGLSVMLLVEMLLVVHEVQLPSWFLPDVTPNDIVTVMHRLYPAFMNGCRCITGAWYVDQRALRVAALDAVLATSRDLSLRLSSVSHGLLAGLERGASEADEALELEVGDAEDTHLESDATAEEQQEVHSSSHSGLGTHGAHGTERTTGVRNGSTATSPEAAVKRVGIMQRGLNDVRRRIKHAPAEGRNDALEVLMQAKVNLIADPMALRKKGEGKSWLSPSLVLVRDTCAYLLARYFLVRVKRG